jgi:UDP-N-acetylglucosamine--N-acetylmuramyl-(pentapeptide) pyrophosphoryl-undecaprenol N-acetylglucosamine transferase
MNAYYLQQSVQSESTDGPPAHIVFAGGGTAGHLFPGLAVAEQLRQVAPETRITFAGTGKDFERRHVSRAGYDYLALPCQPLPKSPGQLWRFIADNFAGARAAASFLSEQNVSLVVGLGSYASAPMGRAAVRQRIPLLLLEQNAYPGRATRHLAHKADVVCLALAKAKLHLRTRGRVYVTGNPVRSEFIRSMGFQPVPAELGHGPEAHATPHRLVVLGGSGGSSQLNSIVPKALHKVRSLLDGWEIVHQSGKDNLAETETLYAKLGLSASVVPFVVNMSQVLSCTDLVIGRAGGTTLAELAVLGVPAVLVPWSEAVGDHQRRNAEVFTRMGAAATLDVAAAIGRLDDALAELLVMPLTHAETREAMATAMRRMARPEATAEVVERIQELLAEHMQTAAA